ncbi:MAG: geranylgeranyl reductase family protein [Candidatus Lokiarchaeota archaeon]|nr:geranylgeranyl reductase family protein [Candidatus Lokiarchaeota archaeon]
MASDTEIIVIGSGPAALAAAKILTHNGIDFQIITEDSKPGQNKVCGGFVSGRAIDDFDLKDIPNSYPVLAVRMKFPGMDSVIVQFDEQVGVNVDRGDLGSYLLKQADIIRSNHYFDCSVTSIERIQRKMVCNVQSGDEKFQVSSGLVIDCSGANPVSLKRGLVRNRLDNGQMGYAMQYHLETDESIPTVNDFYYGKTFSPGGYAWIFPRGQHVVVGTGGLISRVKSAKKNLNEYLNTLLLYISEHENRLNDHRVIKREAAVLPLSGPVTPNHANGILLAGDAGGQCSPITGEGIHYALFAGRIAASVAIEAAREKRFDDDFLKKYDKLWQKEFGSDLKWGLRLQSLFLDSGSDRMNNSFLSSKKNQRKIAELLLGIRSVRGTIFSIIPSYVKSKLLG